MVATDGWVSALVMGANLGTDSRRFNGESPPTRSGTSRRVNGVPPACAPVDSLRDVPGVWGPAGGGRTLLRVVRHTTPAPLRRAPCRHGAVRRPGRLHHAVRDARPRAGEE